jgi:leucyl-tRNA synthetase
MRGFQTLYPMGWDAFGLPAENYAIKTGVHPRISTAQNIANAKRQIQSWGLSFDWSREVNTTDPEYYKWTQWIFLRFFNAGLAYEATGLINWCPKDKTGLANEEVVDGRCERCGTLVEKRQMRQWYLKITAYAQKLIDGLKDLGWPEPVKVQQENWIGRSEGALIKFKVKDSPDSIEVFTTRPDTLFGATYMVLAPDHVLVTKITTNAQKTAVEEYAKQATVKSEMVRTAVDTEKTGVFTGAYAINPSTEGEIPIWVADYVLSNYGTGAIMAVPAHDQRDGEFAAKYGLPIKEVFIPALVDHKNAPQPGKKVVFRNSIMAVVRNPKDDTILILKWKKQPWTTFVMGGIEKGEDAVQAALREIREETGYKNLKFIQALGGQTRSEFFAAHKDENRISHTQTLHFELVDDEREEVSKDETELHEPVWLPAQTLTADVMTHVESGILLERLNTGIMAYGGEGVLVNSDEYDSMSTQEARQHITADFGVPKVQYKLRDWVFSRQRYWGEPIPLVHCPKCGVVPVPEESLPVLLPEVEKYEPTGTGESPLAGIESWVNTNCPKCSGPAKRETNTMPQWAGSSWYFLRYSDPHNSQALASKEKLQYWQPVDVYFGGAEHTTLHLLYSRFWNQFLFDQGIVTSSEPYLRRIPHGVILGPDGERMSKSRGNVVNPDDVIEKFGADSLRMYEMFLGPHDAVISWNDHSIIGVKRFLDKVFAFQPDPTAPAATALHRLIRKIGEDVESFKFNTSIAAFMEFLNQNPKLNQPDFESFLKLLSPFAPHITEEIWERLGHAGSIHSESWPVFDADLLAESGVTIAVQVMGKLRGTVSVKAGATEKEVREIAESDPAIKAHLEGKEVIKVIFVPNRLINYVTK